MFLENSFGSSKVRDTSGRQSNQMHSRKSDSGKTRKNEAQVNFYQAIHPKNLQMKKSLLFCISQKRATAKDIVMFSLVMSCPLDPATNFETTKRLFVFFPKTKQFLSYSFRFPRPIISSNQ